MKDQLPHSIDLSASVATNGTAERRNSNLCHWPLDLCRRLYHDRRAVFLKYCCAKPKAVTRARRPTTPIKWPCANSRTTKSKSTIGFHAPFAERSES